MEDTREFTIDKSKLFFTTTDVCKILKIGRKKCLALFHREDFPCLIYVEAGPEGVQLAVGR